jgi:hypothetical protein
LLEEVVHISAGAPESTDLARPNLRIATVGGKGEWGAVRRERGRT